MKFDVLLCDPPWAFRSRGRPSKRTPEGHYPTLMVEELIELGLLTEPILKKRAALFLWAPYIHIPSVPVVMKAWGFEFRTAAWIWIKKMKSDFSKVHLGLGYYTRNCSEVCWIGVRGNMPVSDKGVPQFMESHRLDYSKKPSLQYDMIDRLYPSSRYPNKLELFATDNGLASRNRYGWEATGLELNQEDIFDALERLAGKKK